MDLYDPAPEAIEGQLIYLAENLASLHASPDLPWLVGRFEFLGEKALGAALSVLAMPDERDVFRPMASGSPRPAVARDAWEQLKINDLDENAEVVSAFRVNATQSRCTRFDLADLFAGQESLGGADSAIVAPVTYNRELIGMGLFVVRASALVEKMADILASHTAAAVYQLRLREEARRLHSVDPRLWVPDEHFILAQFRREVLRARRYGRQVGLAVLRLENEPEIRGRFGDFFTDHLLRRIGSQLKADVRDSDILGALDGGYAVIHTETPLAGTELSANRLRDVVARMVMQRFPEIPEPVFSATSVAYPETADTMDALLERVTHHGAEPLAA